MHRSTLIPAPVRIRMGFEARPVSRRYSAAQRVPLPESSLVLPSELNAAATGEVWFDPILPKTDGVDVGTVVFSPNGRTVWHQHEYGQLLQITSGYGFVCKEGESPHRVRAGDTVWIAPNERHWHGATSSTLMSHTTTTVSSGFGG